MDKKNAQPYLLVRWMSAVYQTVPVILVPSNTTVTLPILKVNRRIQKEELLIPDPAPIPSTDYETENEWTKPRRAALIRRAIQLSKSISLDICVVFDIDDTVYVDPSGRQEVSKHPPSGGIDPITGEHYKEAELSQSGEKEQHKESLAISRTVPRNKPLTLYIQKGDILNSTLYLSNPSDVDFDYPTLREFLFEIEDIDMESDDDLWQYIEENGIYDANECNEHKKEGRDPATLIDNLDEILDESSSEAETWRDLNMDMSPDAIAFHFLVDLAIDDVPGVTPIEGDRPGSNLTFVEIKDSEALSALHKALGEEGYEVSIKRF